MYGQPCMNNEAAKIMPIPYKAGTANHATENETVETMVAPYLADMINHTTMDETVKTTDYFNILHEDLRGLLTLQ